MATVFLPQGSPQPTQTWAGGGGFQPWYYSPGSGFDERRPVGKPKSSVFDLARQGQGNGGMSQYGRPKPNFGGGGGGAGGGGGGGQNPGQNTVTTTITPRNIYTPQMTQQATNQAVASNTPDANFAMKQFARPGVSRSAGTMAAAMPSITSSIGAQRQAMAEIPLLDEIANQKHMMGGQVAREDEALSLANMVSQLQALKDRQRINQMGVGTSLLGNLLQSAGGLV